MKFPYLELKNYPKEAGVYFVGNFNKLQNRIEIDTVIFDGDEVVTEQAIGGYIPSDWDYWSDKIS